MDTLWQLFPQTDFILLAFILGLPLLGAFTNGVFGKRLGKQAVSVAGLAAVGIPFLMSVVAFVMLHAKQEGEEPARFIWTAWRWLTLSKLSVINGVPGEVPVALDVAFSIDALSGTMALIVTGVGFLIHLYSTKYMEEDPGFYRFFAYLNLFIFSMLVLILGNSLPVMFVGWEGVGLCSYLLIGFWFSEEKNAAAGKKAFIANRIGDFGLLVAMGLLLYYTGALDWAGMDANRASLLGEQKIWPLVGDKIWFSPYLPDGIATWLNRERSVSPATLVGLSLFLGCAGKSAQLPLYVWLPDAMAGPTPVSALIHAATMVTAGVYLVCRMAGIFVLSPTAMMVVAVVGALTAFFAATIAFAQNDIKKVLAYSTVSQLGYMFMAVGVGAFSAGFFHVMTHAFFKACLFLGSGSVIYAMHSRIHDSEASQDMRNMGGLRRFMPITFATFAVSWAAIVGFPFTSGFFSKDEILFKTFTSYIALPGAAEGAPYWPREVSLFVFCIAVLTAAMTAFYMTRLVVGTFLGEFRGWTIVKNFQAADGHHNHGDHSAHDHGDAGHAAHATHSAHEHAHANEPLEGPEPHESPWQMTLPLVVLAALALVSGAFNAHVLHSHLLDTWLDPVFASTKGYVQSIEGAEELQLPLLAPGLLAFTFGVGIAYWVYVMQKGAPAARFVAQFPRLHQWAVEKWRVDELYEETVLGAVDTLAEIAVWVDKYVVDGIVARLTAGAVAFSGYVLRQFQTGRVQTYSAVMVIGLGAVGWHFVVPHTEVLTKVDASGGRELQAPSGFGYSYQWDKDGDGKWDSVERTVKVEASAASAIVRLQVTNVFGWARLRKVRPEPTKSDSPTLTLRATPSAMGAKPGISLDGGAR